MVNLNCEYISIGKYLQKFDALQAFDDSNGMWHFAVTSVN